MQSQHMNALHLRKIIETYWNVNTKRGGEWTSKTVNNRNILECKCQNKPLLVLPLENNRNILECKFNSFANINSVTF